MALPRPAETLPMPAETNTLDTVKTLWKNLVGAPTLLQGFGGYTRRCASTPLRNNTAPKREGSPIRKLQPLRVPNGYHHIGSGATVGDSHKGPLVTWEKPFSQKIINANECSLNPTKHCPCGHSPKQEGPRPKETIMTHQPTGRDTPRAILHLSRGAGAPRVIFRLARGTSAPSGDSPPCSRALCLLDGLTPPRAILRLARGPSAPSGDSPPRSRPAQARDAAPTAPTRTLNALALRGRPGEKANPRHTGPLTLPGNRISVLFGQPSL
jgi:hypothetical protein